MNNWIDSNLSHHSHNNPADCSEIWAFRYHHLWTLRNNKLHDLLYVTLHNLVHEVRQAIFIYRDNRHLSLKVQTVVKNLVLVHWRPPPLVGCALTLIGQPKVAFVLIVGVSFMSIKEDDLMVFINLLGIAIVLLMSYVVLLRVWR